MRNLVPIIFNSCIYLIYYSFCTPSLIVIAAFPPHIPASPPPSRNSSPLSDFVPLYWYALFWGLCPHWLGLHYSGPSGPYATALLPSFSFSISCQAALVRLSSLPSSSSEILCCVAAFLYGHNSPSPALGSDNQLLAIVTTLT